MDRKLSSLLLIACLLTASVHLSTSSKNEPDRARRPDKNDHHQSQTALPVATVTVESDHVNITEEVNEAKFVRASDDGSDVPSSEEGGETEEGKGKKDGEKEKEKERLIVTHIPELPPSIAKPGRLFNTSWFIMFYTSWCEHSRIAEPEFLQALQMLADSNVTSMFIGKIDVTKHGDVAKHFKIKATPTFAFFKFGVRYDFIEDPKANKLFEFASKIVNSKIDRVNTTQQLTELQNNHSVLFLLVHDGEIDADWQSVYIRLAEEKALAAKFAYTTEPDVVKDHGINRLPCVMVLKEGKAYVYRDALSGYLLSRWIQTEKFISFPSVNDSNIRTHLHPVSGRRLAMLVVHEKPSERRIAQKKAIEVVKRLASSRHEHTKFQFILLEGTDIARNLLGWTVELPTFFVYEPYSGLYYMHQSGGKGLTEESVIRFLKNITTGVIKPQGGASILDTIIYAGRLGYAVIMTMATHRPVLSVIAVVSVIGVAMFYLTICCRRKTQTITSKSSRALAKKAALKKKKKEEEEARRLEKSKDGNDNSVRKRNRRDDTGIDSEECSQSDVRTGTGSETGTQTEGDSDSQVELEETKKEK